MSSWHNELPALFFSDESPVHTDRWLSALDHFFKDIRVVSANTNLEELAHMNCVVISTPLDLSVQLDRAGLPSDICISNGLDMMSATWSSNFSYIKKRKRQFGSFWVDTRWAESVLSNAGIQHVSRVPWGLARSQLNSLICAASPKREKTLIFPRVRGLHYQPALAVDVAMQAIDTGVIDKAEFIDLLPQIRDSIPWHDYSERLIASPRMGESELTRKIASSSAVVFTPETDGLSVTLLQSIAMGTTVISTPTIGASEVAEALPEAVRIASDHTSDSLLKLIKQVVGTANPQDSTARAVTLDWLTEEADQLALVEKALSCSSRYRI